MSRQVELSVDMSSLQNILVFAEDGAVLDFRNHSGSVGASTLLYYSPNTQFLGTIPTSPRPFGEPYANRKSRPFRFRRE